MHHRLIRHEPFIIRLFLLAALGTTATSLPLGAQGSDASPHLTAAEAGARFGQAKGAERFCPGGRATAHASDLAKAYKGAARSVFDTEAAKILAGWEKALSCREADPETGRIIVACRRVKLLSCRQAWTEIGPQGTAVRGLLDLKLDDLGAEPATASKPLAK